MNMSMSDEAPRMQPWQVFQAARKYLGANIVAHIFNREVRSAHNWAQDPVHTECRCKSPLELLHTLFERMDAAGVGYATRAGIEYLSTALDPTVQVGGIKEPLPRPSRKRSWPTTRLSGGCSRQLYPEPTSSRSINASARQ